jgi:hypothetical protein
MRRNLVISIVLFAAALAVYGQTLRFSFVNYDDPGYVTQNTHVRAGLTGAGFNWAITTNHLSNWHPMTWLSHMLDCQIFGVRPGPAHLTNVLLHAVNALLLFAVLIDLTGARWRSAVVAGLFALHPLHVESVAWIAERKDVLSTCFGLLSVWAYVKYARRGGIRWYLLAALCLAVGLMSKPMLVSLPLLLLLADYWPLGRTDWRRLLLEKAPLAALVAASCVVTYLVQRNTGAMGQVVLPPLVRAGHALVAYVLYIGNTIWPVDLAVLYTHPYLPGGAVWQPWQVAAGAAVLALMSLLALVFREKPYVLVGWLWFVISLVPVIGLVQVGSQAMADRYSYLPATGLFIIAVWGIGDFIAASRVPRRLLRPAVAVLAVAVLIACAVASHIQVQYWQNSLTLYQRAIDAGQANAVTHTNLGAIHHADRNYPAAMTHYRQAIGIDPDYWLAHVNLAMALKELGQRDDAINHFFHATRLNPNLADAHAILRAARAGPDP